MGRIVSQLLTATLLPETNIAPPMNSTAYTFYKLVKCRQIEHKICQENYTHEVKHFYKSYTLLWLTLCAKM